MNTVKCGNRTTLAEANNVCAVPCVQSQAEGEMYSYHGTSVGQDTPGTRPCGSQGSAPREFWPHLSPIPAGAHQPWPSYPVRPQVGANARKQNDVQDLMFFQIHKDGCPVDGASYPSLEEAFAALETAAQGGEVTAVDGHDQIVRRYTSEECRAARDFGRSARLRSKTDQ